MGRAAAKETVGKLAADGGARAAAEGLRIDYRPVETLIPYARNARTHSAAQVALIAGSIREFGWTNPILVDCANGIIAGHGRVLAAQQLGMTQVPVIELAHLSEAQRRALVLADNKLAEQAGWDKELLALELGELNDLGIELADLGFGTGEIDALLRGTPDPREDEVPPVPEVPVSRPGDVWCLGSHRLICGDATKAEEVARLLGSVRPHLMVTDPPYGVAYDPAWRNRAGASTTKRVGKVLNDHRADWREAWTLFPGEVAYIWHGALHATTVAESLMATGFVTLVDRAALAAYCQAWGRWVEAEEKLKETPFLIRTPSGYIQQSPWLGIANRQMEIMGRYMAELGITPASRSRVAAFDAVRDEPVTRIEHVIVYPETEEGRAQRQRDEEERRLKDEAVPGVSRIYLEGNL